MNDHLVYLYNPDCYTTAYRPWSDLKQREFLCLCNSYREAIMSTVTAALTTSPVHAAPLSYPALQHMTEQIAQ